jgi:hypothetical protein
MERPGTRELEYFVAVAEELNLSRAAACLQRRWRKNSASSSWTEIPCR